MHGAGQLPPWPRVWAHRGGGRLAPENTLAGFARAVALGCRGVEFDVMLSSEGTPVLIHDETVDRTTDGRGRVAELSDAALAQLDAGSRCGPEWASERIPTLAQALAAGVAADLFLNVEIKPASGFEADTGRVAAELVACILAGREGQVVLSSFSDVALAAARAAASQLPRGLLVGRVPADWRARCEALDCIALHADIRCLHAEHVAEAASAGLRVAAYTENSLGHARQALAWGLAAVITDWPDRISEATLGFAGPEPGAA